MGNWSRNYFKQVYYTQSGWGKGAGCGEVRAAEFREAKVSIFERKRFAFLKACETLHFTLLGAGAKSRSLPSACARKTGLWRQGSLERSRGRQWWHADAAEAHESL